jgi:hypothetical protein
LHIQLKQNTTAKVFAAQYPLDNLPNIVKTNYKTLSEFLEEIQFIVKEKNHDRLKIQPNG